MPQDAPRPSGTGVLSLVGTPIGNLGDLSGRVRDTLAAADVVLCEDTRVTGRLLSAMGLRRPLERCDENVIASRVPAVLERLTSGQRVAFASDAGMPAVSDPGRRLVDAALDAGLPVEVVPGPSAVTCAVAASGLDCSHFFFEGFLPRKAGARRERLDLLARVPGAVVLHTSGTLPQEILLPLSADAGILYPLQTFSKDVAVDLTSVPFFIEGATPRAAAVARTLAESLSREVHYADAEKRKTLHIAGVLGCNFPNYLWDCCRRLLDEAGYPLGVIEPLVRATVDKAFAVGPHAAQTGPARRRDTDVIAAHVKALPAPLAEIYQKISDEIIKSHYEQNSI